ncbi:MAG: hypothetical protein ACK4RK_19130 [Gemmataceae bacterium]
MDKLTELLLTALKQAIAEPGEQRLFKSGKLTGLFASKAGTAGEAATQALQQGLLEVSRTETKGKTSIEWVKVTPKGIQFVHEHDSPLRVLEELRTILRLTQDGLPAWLEQMRQQLDTLGNQLTEEVQRLARRLDVLSERVEASLRRAEAARPVLSNGLAGAVPWGLDALTYLDQRQTSGAPEPCPLPELFAALRSTYAELSLPDFHDGLRRLRDGGALRLLPVADLDTPLPEPEYALLLGGEMLYFASRK